MRKRWVKNGAINLIIYDSIYDGGMDGSTVMNILCLKVIDFKGFFGAGNETRTRDPNLGKVLLYSIISNT